MRGPVGGRQRLVRVQRSRRLQRTHRLDAHARRRLHRRLQKMREDARPLLPGVPDLGDGPDVQLWPHRHGTDAMFLSLLRRNPG